MLSWKLSEYGYHDEKSHEINNTNSQILQQDPDNLNGVKKLNCHGRFLNCYRY